MKHTLFLILLILLIDNTEAQQESNSLELTKILHSEKIESKMSFIKEINITEGSKEITGKDLYGKIAQAYDKLFTPEEITDMFAFYNSALGKKVLENERKVNREVSTIVRKWEMEQRGIEQRQTSRIVDGKRVDTDTLRALKRKEIIAKRKAEKEAPFPKINNLNDLKKLIEKQPYIVSDRRLLLELFGEKGIEKLTNPESRILERN